MNSRLCFSSGGNLKDVVALNPREKSQYPDTDSDTAATDMNTEAQRHFLIFIPAHFSEEEL